MPRLFCFSLGALCSLLITALVFEHRLSRISEQQNQNYGAALARMAAQQGVDAALNHDLVSLQVILQDVAANPDVLLATIHDVENNLLVQAGNATLAKSTDRAVSNHTAPITLHDSVAGYVTVTVSEADLHRGIVWTVVVVIGTLLALVGGLSLYENRAGLFIRRERLRSSAPSAPPEPEYDDATSAIDGGTHHVTAQLQVANLPSLRQQLTAALLASTVDNLNQLLDHVLALYGGQLEPLEDEGSYRLLFESTESSAEAAFRAACSVYLTSRLAAQLSPMRVDLIAAIGADDSTATALAEDQRERVVLQETLAMTDLLQQRLVLAPASQPGASVLQDFHQPFAALLERQYEQLTSLVP